MWQKGRAFIASIERSLERRETVARTFEEWAHGVSAVQDSLKLVVEDDSGGSGLMQYHSMACALIMKLGKVKGEIGADSDVQHKLDFMPYASYFFNATLRAWKRVHCSQACPGDSRKDALVWMQDVKEVHIQT